MDSSVESVPFSNASDAVPDYHGKLTKDNEDIFFQEYKPDTFWSIRDIFGVDHAIQEPFDT